MDNALAKDALAKINELQARIAELEGDATTKSKGKSEIGLIKARKLSDVPRAGHASGAALAAANFGEGISKAYADLQKERGR